MISRLIHISRQPAWWAVLGSLALVAIGRSVDARSDVTASPTDPERSNMLYGDSNTVDDTEDWVFAAGTSDYGQGYYQSSYYSQAYCQAYYQSTYYSQAYYQSTYYSQTYYQPGYGLTLSGNVNFLGNLTVVGSVSKGGGSFAIDHPQKPATHLLYHSFVESPNVTNVYDGTVTLDAEGKARVRLPRYFEALNKQFTYQYFPLDEAMPNLHIAQEVTDNVFEIAGGVPFGRVSWQVTGIRHDPYILANPVRNEVMKGPDELYDVGECAFEPLCEE